MLATHNFHHHTSGLNQIHYALEQTIAERKILFELYQNKFNTINPDIHSQLQQTIREHKAAMQNIFRNTNI